MRGVLFWVNLARKDKGVEPTAQVLHPQDVPVRFEGDAIVRVLAGDGSPVELGTPGLILDVELQRGGAFSTRFRPTSTASSTCWKARPVLARTVGGRGVHRSPFLDRVAR
jgi:redox-sensitive bicupin YhaK (pirin superfamily)